jgi:hypothetical protein
MFQIRVVGELDFAFKWTERGMLFSSKIAALHRTAFHELASPAFDPSPPADPCIA